MVERLDAQAATASEGAARRVVPPVDVDPSLPSDGPPRTRSVSWVAVLTLSSALGIATCTAGDALSRSTRSTSQLLFWVGVLAIVAPIVWRLVSRLATRGERIALVVLLGLALYLVKVVRSPFGFDLPDELAHAPNSNAILHTHKLFAANSILPVAAHYPGLESVDAAFAAMSGLTPYGGGLVVIGAARVVIMLALYLLFERICGSSRTAALGTAMYTANASFLFFDAQVSYESLALPLLVLILFAVAEWQRTQDRWSWGLVAVFVTLAVVVTHHITSYALVVLLAALCVVQLVVRKRLARRSSEPGFSAQTVARGGLSEQRKALVERYILLASPLRSAWLPRPGAARRQRKSRLAGTTRLRQRVADQPVPWAFLLVSVLATIGWLTFVADTTVGYLRPVFTNAFLSTIRTLSGESAPRHLFTATQGPGHPAPYLERAVGLGSYALMAAAVPFGLRTLRRRYGYDPFALILGLASVAFFGLAVLRLAPGAWETAERASEFLFIGLGFVLAQTGLHRWTPRWTPWLGRLLAVAFVSVIFAGGVIAGAPPSSRLSQPYLVRVGGHTIAPQGRQLARWAASNLKPGARYAAADADARFLDTYARGFAVTSKAFDVDGILRAPGFAPWQRTLLARARVTYVVADRQTTSYGDSRGYFFARRGSAELLPIAVARKFDRHGADRLYDSGAIRVYKLKGVGRVAQKP